MTEQQYRVFADRDKGDDPTTADICAGDRYTMQAERGPVFADQVVRIERPVPTEHCLSTAHHGTHSWGANPGADGGVWCPGFDASDESPVDHIVRKSDSNNIILVQRPVPTTDEPTPLSMESLLSEPCETFTQQSGMTCAGDPGHVLGSHYGATEYCWPCRLRAVRPSVPTREQIAEVIESLHSTIAFDSRDWGETRRDAWLYGIILGWDGPEDAMTEVATRYGWSDATVERLRGLHATVALFQNGAD